MIEIKVSLDENGIKKSKVQIIMEVAEELNKQCDPFKQGIGLVKYRKAQDSIILKYDSNSGSMLSRKDQNKSPYKDFDYI